MGTAIDKDVLYAKPRDLKRRTYNELTNLATYQEEVVRRGKVKLTVAVWKDVLTCGDVQIVVQVHKPWMLGFGAMTAAGFRMAPSGETKDLEGNELQEFT